MASATWTDDPTSRGDEDTLGRLPYAQRAADLIMNTHSLESSVVFGLSGPWGSGKSSMVNMIVEHIEKQDVGWLIARFTPWATSTIDSLIAEFYSSLAQALPPKKTKRARAALGATARVAAPMAQLIPVAGSAASDIAKMTADALTKNPPWQVAYERASAELKKLEKPVLVVVDDIDRLHHEELLVLMKVVRLLGRFDGMQYLLAYDDETLHRNIQSAGVASRHDGTPERFMEKIVQHPLVVPPLLRHQQIRRLNDGFAVVARPHAAGESAERVGSLIDCFLGLLTTPRAIDRYLAQLAHHVPLLPPEEVDDEDVYLLTLIRVSLPALYNVLHGHRTELLTGTTGRLDPNDLGKHEPFDAAVLLEHVPTPQRERAKLLLESLFPEVAGEGVNFAYPSRRRQAIRHEEYFDRYFAMGILDHDVADLDVAGALASAADGDQTALASFFLSTKPENWALMLSKAVGLTVSVSGGNQERQNLALAIATLTRNLPTVGNGPFTPLDEALRWAAEQIVGFNRDMPSETVKQTVTAFGDLSRQIRVWRRVADQIQQTYRDDPPTWFAETHSWIVDAAVDSIEEHLRQGDDAPLDLVMGARIVFVLRYARDTLAQRVQVLHETGQVSIEVIASRCVGVLEGGSEPDSLYEEVHQNVFDQIAPPGEDPWYDLPQQEVNRTDLSWANRRRFATGRFVPPRRSAGR